MSHQARMGGQLSEDDEEDDLGGEQQPKARRKRRQPGKAVIPRARSRPAW